MKRKWILVAALASFLLRAEGAFAQGPQGNGAAEAAQGTAGPHLSNPLKWVKKDPHTEAASLDATSDQAVRLASRLRTQGLLAPQADLKDTCSPIKELGDCVAALHAGRNLGVDFDCLKSKLSGVQVRLEMPSCKSGTDGTPVNLTKAIHSLKPEADAKAEAKKADAQSKEDLRDMGAGT